MKSDIEVGRDALSASREKLSKDIAAAAGNATELLKNLGERKLDSAKEALAEARSAVTDEARHAAGSAESYVRAHPWKAMGVAASAGLLLGLVLARS
jgi:ElaB/YqjD/DUF883 family membrane-anchored ribosome-binding protein